MPAASAAAPSAVVSRSAATSTGSLEQVGLELHQEPVRGRAAVGAEDARRLGQRVDDVGDLVGDRLERRPHEVRLGRPAREPGDEAARVRRPTRACRGR